MKMLLVEDSPEVSLITVEYLIELGHEVVAVPDAESALTQVSKDRFDAVMTDVSLPGISGIELARALINQHPRLPVIIASGYGSLNLESLQREPSRLNVLALTKPYDLATLEQTLNRAASIVAAPL